MPVYDFECPGCRIKITESVSIHEELPNPKCDTCDSEMRKLFGTVAIQFKGAGFYSTGGGH